jgi:hypothetical protein
MLERGGVTSGGGGGGGDGDGDGDVGSCLYALRVRVRLLLSIYINRNFFNPYGLVLCNTCPLTHVRLRPSTKFQTNLK